MNQPNALTGEGTTQFVRALYELDIELICVNTPQPKGRVERANGTLQDRLVKELRLLVISDLATANTHLPAFRLDFNRRFAVAARDPHDAHRPLRPADDLTRILAIRELRTLSKNLTLQHDNAVHQIQSGCPSYALRHAQVEVRERWGGRLTIFNKGKLLAHRVSREPPRQAELLSTNS